MRASGLRHRVNLYRQTSTRSATGAVKVERWEHFLTLWANFNHLSVKDAIAGQAAGTNVTARCQIRHRTDIDHTMQLEYDGKRYHIVGEPLAGGRGGREYLTLMLKSANHAN